MKTKSLSKSKPDLSIKRSRSPYKNYNQEGYQPTYESPTIKPVRQTRKEQIITPQRGIMVKDSKKNSIQEQVAKGLKKGYFSTLLTNNAQKSNKLKIQQKESLIFSKNPFLAQDTSSVQPFDLAADASISSHMMTTNKKSTSSIALKNNEESNHKSFPELYSYYSNNNMNTLDNNQSNNNPLSRFLTQSLVGQVRTMKINSNNKHSTLEQNNNNNKSQNDFQNISTISYDLSRNVTQERLPSNQSKKSLNHDEPYAVYSGKNFNKHFGIQQRSQSPIQMKGQKISQMDSSKSQYKLGLVIQGSVLQKLERRSQTPDRNTTNGLLSNNIMVTSKSLIDKNQSSQNHNTSSYSKQHMSQDFTPQKQSLARRQYSALIGKPGYKVSRPCLLGCTEDSKDHQHIYDIRNSKPIYSPDRYQMELQKHKEKQEKAYQVKMMLEKEREIAENMDIALNQVKPHDRVVKIEDLNKKIELQTKHWQDKQQRLDKSRSPSPSFKPEINKISKELTMNQEKIENRIKEIQNIKKKALEFLVSQTIPSFTPQINRKSERMVEQIRQRSNTPEITGQMSLNVTYQQSYKTIASVSQQKGDKFIMKEYNTLRSQKNLGQSQSMTSSIIKNSNSIPSIQQSPSIEKKHALNSNISQKQQAISRNSYLNQSSNQTQKISENKMSRNDLTRKEHLQKFFTMNPSYNYSQNRPQSQQILDKALSVSQLLQNKDVASYYEQSVKKVHFKLPLQKANNSKSKLTQEQFKQNTNDAIYFIDKIFQRAKVYVNAHKQSSRQFITQEDQEDALQNRKDAKIYAQSLIQMALKNARQLNQINQSTSRQQQQVLSNSNRQESIDKIQVKKSKKQSQVYAIQNASNPKTNLYQPVRQSQKTLNQHQHQNNSSSSFQKLYLTNDKDQKAMNIKNASKDNNNSIGQNLSQIDDVTKYLDNETKILLEQRTLSMSSESLKREPSRSSLTSSNSDKQKEIINKLLLQSSRRDSKLLHLTKDVMDEIEESGLDSITILRQVIREFKYLFKQQEQ